MSVQPYISPLAPPYNPNASGTSSGNTIPSNASIPDLEMVWQVVPDPIAAKASPSGSSNKGSSARFGASTVDFPSADSTLNAILKQCSIIVDEYEYVKSQFQSLKDSAFGQTSIWREEIIEDKTGHPYFTWISGPDPLQSDAQGYANGSNGDPGMNDIQAYTLQSIGNGMAAVGQWIALTQIVLQGLADADFNSQLPPVNLSH